jgi:hypothetical protein
VHFPFGKYVVLDLIIQFCSKPTISINLIHLTRTEREAEYVLDLSSVIAQGHLRELISIHTPPVDVIRDHLSHFTLTYNRRCSRAWHYLRASRVRFAPLLLLQCFANAAVLDANRSRLCHPTGSKVFLRVSFARNSGTPIRGMRKFVTRMQRKERGSFVLSSSSPSLVSRWTS